MVKLVLLDEAQDELVDAISRYESIELGLGRSLRDEVGSNLVWIQAHPEVPRLRPPGYYRVNLRTFPYYIPYSFEVTYFGFLPLPTFAADRCIG